MNKLTELLTKGLLEDEKRTVTVYGGGFKPPTAGHFEVVDTAIKKNPNIDKLIIQYDDLISQTQNTINKICSFCNKENFNLNINKLKQLELNGIKYNDEHVKAPLHTIKTDKIEKNNKNYDDILPVEIYDKYKHFDEIWEKTPNFNFINKIDNFENIKKYVKFFMDKDWKEYTFRQDSFDVHAETQTIPIIYNENFDKEILDKGTHHSIFIKILGSIES